MATSEIDEIFAFKGKSSASKPSPSTEPTDPPPKKAKKSGKRKREANLEPEETEGKRSAKRRVPETVLDPSARLSAPATSVKQSKKPDKTASTGHAKKKSKKGVEDEERFKDSRGTGSRRTTEEGFAIYKESELGITDQGGDTPLCPFDCQCCF